VDVAALTYRHRMRSRGEVSPGSRHAVVAGVAVAVALVALALLFALGLWLWGPIGSAANSSEEPAAGSGGDAVATSAPVFATDEEALAAATEAYARYQEAIDRALAAADATGLDAVAEGAALTAAESFVQDFKQRGIRQSGDSSVDTVSLVSPLVPGVGGADVVQIYACVDVSQVGVFDAGGVSQLGESIQSRAPFIATLVRRGAHFVVSDDDYWEGQTFCE
jgi:hypothetical protein